MPLYDYECSACSHSFTLRQGYFDEPLATCPECGGAGQRRFHVPTIVYKGSGFYTTDYARRRTSSSEDFWNKPEHGEEREAKSEATGAAESSSSPHPHEHPSRDGPPSHDD